MTDLDKVKHMEDLNWKPASQYWCEQYHIKRKKLVEAADEIERLRCALAHITNIKNEMYGGDWDEIEHARTIARAALEGSK